MNLLMLLFIFNFIRTLLIILIIYYGIRLVTRYVLPILLEKGMKNMQQKMQDQGQQPQGPSRHEGEVTIEQNRTNQKNTERDQGEYIDFEEVD